MDQLDYQIITELQKDSRKKNRQIARALGVSETTIRRRINSLLESGTIQLTSIVVPDKIGYPIHAFMQMQIELSQTNSIIAELLQYPEVHYVCICSGEYQVLVVGMFMSPNQFSTFITEQVGKIHGIIRTETITHLKYAKRTYGLGFGEPDVAERDYNLAGTSPDRTKRLTGNREGKVSVP